MHDFSQQNQIDFVNQVMTFVAQELSQIWRIQINMVLHPLMCSTGKPWQASCRSGLRDLLHRANTLPCAAGMEQKTIITTLTRKPILMYFRRSDRTFQAAFFFFAVLTSVAMLCTLWSFKESGSSLHFETSCTTEHGANLHPQAQLVASSVTPSDTFLWPLRPTHRPTGLVHQRQPSHLSSPGPPQLQLGAVYEEGHLLPLLPFRCVWSLKFDEIKRKIKVTTSLPRAGQTTEAKFSRKSSTKMTPIPVLARWHRFL